MSHIRRHALTAFIVILAGYNLWSWSDARRQQGPELALGSLAPTVRLPRLDGGEIEVGPQQGKVVLIDFWATWCKPCIRSMPKLVGLARRFEGRPFQIVLVNQDASSADRMDDVVRFVEERGITLPVAMDNGRAGPSFGMSALPYTVLLGPNGSVAHRWAGEADPETMAKLIGELLPDSAL